MSLNNRVKKELVETVVWLYGYYYRYLCWHQKHISHPEECGYPFCHREWHDMFLELQCCKVHHPKYDPNVFETIFKTP